MKPKQKDKNTSKCEATPKVSVCMTMYNAAPYLRECIDSILTQTFTDFELLIVDDGSTDCSREIVRSYDDPRIRLVCNKHDYIKSLNTLLREARGKYIARMDADDVMMPKRLSVQFDFMESHHEVDALGGNMLLSEGKSTCLSQEKPITIFEMLANCSLAHPTVMLRAGTLHKLHLLYEKDFLYAEDYRMWMQMLKSEAILMNISECLIKYRASSQQISQIHFKEQQAATIRIKQDMREWICQQEKDVKEEQIIFPRSGNEMTLVIPFMNEGEEVGNTIRSARHFVGDKVDIIVINDHSTDGYDYETDLKGLNVRYIVNKFNIGAAASKEKGARLATTPYFILLDAHMRFYDSRWLQRYLDE